MKALALCLGVLLASQASARDIPVRSGEHTGFTRIVVEDPSIQSWRIGRTKEGYALQLSPDKTFDLSGVFRLIRRNRIAAISTDADSGDLRIDLGCTCHAVAEELRPGVIVIDIADGAPPADSPHESPVAMQQAQVTVEPPRPRQRPTTGYEWQSLPTVEPAPPPVIESPSLSLMRTALLEQLSRGAATGAVEIAPQIPRKTVSAGAEPPPEDALAQVKIGETPGFDAAATDRAPDQLTAKGEACVPDHQLAIHSWGTDAPVAEQMAEIVAGLTGEFDNPDIEAAEQAVRFYLHIGFGAEAEQILRTFQLASPDTPVWRSMAQILDRGPVQDSAFHDMAVCDTAAALWSVLANPESASEVNRDALLRSFSGLPAHLRRQLGPRLAEIFIADGDPATARTIRDATARAPGPPDPEVDLMAAQVDIAEGNAAEGLAALKAVAAEPGPAGPEALLLLAERQISTGEAPRPETVAALGALLQDHGKTSLGARLQRAHRLGLAAIGDFEAAFAADHLAPDSEPDLWRMLAESAPDSALLEHAILSEAKAPSLADEDVRLRLAERLLDLGFAEPASRWLMTPPAETAEKVLAARIWLRLGDPASAMDQLQGLTDAQAASLRGEAQILLDDAASARSSFAASGDVEGTLRAARGLEDWAAIAAQGSGTWAEAARLVDPQSAGRPQDAPAEPLTGEQGPLARSRQALKESAAARQKIDALLSELGPSGQAP